MRKFEVESGLCWDVEAANQPITFASVVDSEVPKSVLAHFDSADYTQPVTQVKVVYKGQDGKGHYINYKLVEDRREPKNATDLLRHYAQRSFVTLELMQRDHAHNFTFHSLCGIFELMQDITGWDTGFVVVDDNYHHLASFKEKEPIPEFVCDRSGNNFKVEPKNILPAVFPKGIA